MCPTCCCGARVTDDASHLREQLIDDILVSTQGDTLDAVRRGVNDDTLITGTTTLHLDDRCLLPLLLSGLWRFLRGLHLFQSFHHRREIVVTCLLVECLHFGEVAREEQSGGSHEIKDVAKEMTIPIDEVMLLQRVKDDWYVTSEELAEP